MKHEFTHIYDQNIWNGSGHGSRPEVTQTYRSYLQSFLTAQCITSVADLGCGDWSFSKLINWENVQYHGYDVVDQVIRKNTKRYKKSSISFSQLDISTCAVLPTADLAILKDVLQHWSNQDIINFLPKLNSYKHVLITNSIVGMQDKVDIAVGDVRNLDITKPPFNLVATHVLTFYGSLLDNGEGLDWKCTTHYQPPQKAVA